MLFRSERAQEIMDVQQNISFEKNQEKIGKTFKVLIDKKEAGRYLGRTEFDSVEVDNEVIIHSKKKLKLMRGHRRVLAYRASSWRAGGPSRLVATAAEDRLNIRHNAHVVFRGQRLPTQIAFDDPLADVRFAPESGRIADIGRRLKSANC